ncbi:MAG: DUF433 domain-containing protein [Myxococcota bacterium]
MLLTTTEAAALTGLDERAVRKDVEHGILDVGSPPRFAEVALVYLRACATFTFHLVAQDRKRLYAAVADALQRGATQLDLGPGWTVDIAALARDLHERIAGFDMWRESLVVRDDILGGEPVFPGSRLAVRQVGQMLIRGADPAEIHEDYPELSDRDLDFSRLYAVAYPRIGRPSATSSLGIPRLGPETFEPGFASRAADARSAGLGSSRAATKGSGTEDSRAPRLERRPRGGSLRTPRDRRLAGVQKQSCPDLVPFRPAPARARLIHHRAAGSIRLTT